MVIVWANGMITPYKTTAIQNGHSINQTRRQYLLPVPGLELGQRKESSRGSYQLGHPTRLMDVTVSWVVFADNHVQNAQEPGSRPSACEGGCGTAV